MTSIPYNNLISKNYNNQQLTLIADEPSMNWDEHPVNITSTVLSTFKNFSNVMTIISGQSKSPSDLIGLKKEDILCGRIHNLNREYDMAIKSYEKSLVIANNEDLKKIRELTNDWNATANKVSVAMGAGAGGVGALSCVGVGALSGAWGGPLGVIVGGGGGLFFGLVGGFFATRQLIKQYIANEGSVHRIAWLKEIDTLEMKRMEKIAFEISMCATPLMIELFEMEQVNEYCTRRVKNLSQLQKIFEKMFPNTPLEIKNEDTLVNIKQFLTEHEAKCQLVNK